jgi:phosphatidate phosphatase PAH1
MGEGARGQDSGEKERVRERESEHRLAADVVSVVKRTIRKYTCLIKLDGQHLAGLLLISKMRNLAHDVSHDRSVLTVNIFGAMTTRHFLIKI